MPTQLPWRIIFAVAAAYNIAFGCWAGFLPTGFFDSFDLVRPIYPGIWQCLGMVVGVYGLGYAYVAWKPERGDVLALLGLIGKILGPIGWLTAVKSGDLPARTFPLILCNDLIWWYPITLYLLRRHRYRRVLVTLLVVAFHVFASVMLLLVREGTESQSDLALREQFIATHLSMWVTCWFLWVASSLGLMVFFVLWANTLAERGASVVLLIACCAVALVGLGFDLTNEIILITKLTNPAIQGELFAYWARRATVFGAGFGNAYYCVAGVLMAIISRHAGLHRSALFAWGIAVWLCGFVLSAAAFLEQGLLMTIAGGALMAIFIPWAALTGLRFSIATNER